MPLYVGESSISAVNTAVEGTAGVMKGATNTINGASGLVPAPTAGQQAHVLHGDGTWKEIEIPDIEIPEIDTSKFSIGLENQLLSDNTFATGYSNIAGGKAFKIQSLTDLGDGTGQYHLDAVTGLEIGMRYSAAIKLHAYNQGQITAINSITNTVTVDNFLNYEMNDNADNGDSYYNLFIITGHPELGTINIARTAVAEGYNTIAQNICSHAEGNATIAIGKYSHAEGRETIAAHGAHAEGKSTQALANFSHAEGNTTVTRGHESHAEGANTIVELDAAAGHAEGIQTAVKEGAWAGHAEGYATNVEGNAAHAEGTNTFAYGNFSHAEGELSRAKGLSSHAEGYNTIANANYSHTEGQSTEANGNNSHAEGLNSIASGNNSHAEGREVSVLAGEAHGEGYQGTINSGAWGSHLEGYSNIINSSAYASHVEGYDNSPAVIYGSHVEGRFSAEDTKSRWIHVVGNGISDTNRHNAQTINLNGTAWFQGPIYVGGDSESDASIKKVVTQSTVINGGIGAAANDTNTIYLGDGKYRLAYPLITSTSIVEMIPRTTITKEGLLALQKANLVGIGQGEGYIDFQAFGTIPTVAIPVTFIIRGDA